MAKVALWFFAAIGVIACVALAGFVVFALVDEPVSTSTQELSPYEREHEQWQREQRALKELENRERWREQWDKEAREAGTP